MLFALAGHAMIISCVVHIYNRFPVVLSIDAVSNPFTRKSMVASTSAAVLGLNNLTVNESVAVLTNCISGTEVMADVVMPPAVLTK